MLWENTFRSCVLEQCCQSWNVLRECIFLQKCAEILIFLSSLWDQLRQMVYLWDLNTAWRDQSRCSSQLPALSQELKGLCVSEILSGICRHTQGPAAVDSGLRTDSGRFSASHGEHVGFQGNCTLGGLLAQCYRGNHEEHWSLFAFMGSAHSETVQDKEGAKCACKTYTCQRHLLCPAALLSGHSKYSLQTIPNCFHSSDASAYQESKAAI